MTSIFHRSAVTEVVVNGFNILADPLVRHDRAAGRLHLRGGRLPFAPTDLVHLSLVEADRGITPLTGVTRLTAYADAAAIRAERPLLRLTGGPCPVDGLTALLGDGFLGFDAGALSGGPRLGQLLLVRGRDLRSVPREGLVLPTLDAPDRVLSELDPHVVLETGALVDTPQGPRFADSLRPGEKVLTLDAGPRPIRSVHRQRLPGGAAVRLQPGAIGNLRTLIVAPEQPLLVRGPAALEAYGTAQAILPARDLVNGGTIREETRAPRDAVRLGFDGALSLYAEGAVLSTGDDPRAAIGHPPLRQALPRIS